MCAVLIHDRNTCTVITSAPVLMGYLFTNDTKAKDKKPYMVTEDVIARNGNATDACGRVPRAYL